MGHGRHQRHLGPAAMQVCRALAFALVCLVVASGASAEARSPAALAGVRASVDSWLQARGLTPAFELQKLRWGPRADEPSSRWLKLELRFVSEGEDQDRENARFAAAASAFRVSNGVPLAEALLFKLVNLGGVTRSDARVQVSVLNETFAVVRDPHSQGWTFEAAADRQVRLEVTLPDLGDSSAQRRMQAELPAASPLGALQDRVQRFLQDYFARANAAARLPPPRVAMRPLKADYVGMEVMGLRRLVIPGKNYWERLTISIELRETGQSRIAVCYPDGAYAAGLGLRLPADDAYTNMEPAYKAELERFAEALMRALQEELAHDAH